MSLFAVGCSTVQRTADYPQAVQSQQSQLPVVPVAPVVNYGELLITIFVVLAIIIFFVIVFSNNKTKGKNIKKSKKGKKSK